MVLVQCRVCYGNGKVAEWGGKGRCEVLGDVALVANRYRRCEGLRRSWRRGVSGEGKQECRIAVDPHDQIF